MKGKDFVDLVNDAIAEADCEAWKKHQAILRGEYDYFGEVDFEQVSEAELDAFMAGKTVVKVEPVDAPVTDGFIIYLYNGGPALWAAEIDCDAENPDKVLTASVARLV